MTPEEYCYLKIAPSGSAIYYSVRKLKRSDSNAVVAILAFYKELEDITLDYHDLSVAQAKLDWWRDQIIKSQDDKPEHPVAIFLQETIPDLGSKLSQFIQIIEGLEQNLTPVVFNSFEDVVIHFMRTAGVRELLIASILQKDEVSPEVIYQFTLVIELVNFIQHLRRYMQRGLIYFPRDEMQKFHVNENDFHSYKTSLNIVSLIQFQNNKIEYSFQQARKSLSKQGRILLSNLIIRSEIAIAVWRAIQSENFKVLESYIQVTPLKCWWIALKT